VSSLSLHLHYGQTKNRSHHVLPCPKRPSECSHHSKRATFLTATSTHGTMPLLVSSWRISIGAVVHFLVAAVSADRFYCVLAKPKWMEKPAKCVLTVELSVWQDVGGGTHFPQLKPGRFFLGTRTQIVTRDWFIYELCVPQCLSQCNNKDTN
jgi:hypothetical protein